MIFTVINRKEVENAGFRQQGFYNKCYLLKVDSSLNPINFTDTEQHTYK